MENSYEEYIPEQTAPKKKRSWKFWLFGGIITAAVAAIVVATILIFSNTYKTPVKLWEKSYNIKKASKIMDSYVNELNGFCEDDCKEALKILKKSDVYEEILESYEDLIDIRIDEYGKNYKVKLKVVDKEEIDKDDLKEARDMYREYGEDLIAAYENVDYEDIAYDLGITESQAKKLVKSILSVGKTLKKAKISKGYVLTINDKLTSSELDEPVEDEYEMCVYKINGRWVSEDILDFMVRSLRYGDLY